ncbi:hypothetical protein J6590_030962 [Homalodisca vitripennis]|nr:hypothetical protein J6590_030962 [Homalodisca vitripennis]
MSDCGAMTHSRSFSFVECFIFVKMSDFIAVTLYRSSSIVICFVCVMMPDYRGVAHSKSYSFVKCSPVSMGISANRTSAEVVDKRVKFRHSVRIVCDSVYGI